SPPGASTSRNRSGGRSWPRRRAATAPSWSGLLRRFGHRDAALAGRFGAIHGGVGARHDLGRRLARRWLDQRKADRDAERARKIARILRKRHRVAQQRLGACRGTIAAETVDPEREFIAAEPRHEIAGAARTAQDFGERQD